MRNANILYAGIFLVVLPFLGFPSGWRNFFVVAIGIGLCYRALSPHKNRPIARKNSQRKSATLPEPSHLNVTHDNGVVEQIMPNSDISVSQSNEQPPQL